MTLPPGPLVELKEVTKRFGNFTAIREVDLAIQAGEFLTLLGPSGCGKTTLLRMISGFETPSAGSVWINGEEVTHAPPYRRNVNQVFQSYALFPHLTVAENIGFGLRMQKVAKRELVQRVQEVIALVSLGGLEQRKPAQLSGGQRQRVALARAIVCRPRVLLLDEPLSALDAKLRHGMQMELKRLQKTLGITFVLVTHDQEEALTVSDRIAVVNEGRIEQLGEAAEIYRSPRTTFVATFIGRANILEAQWLAADAAGARLRLSAEVDLRIENTDSAAATGDLLVSIRPEKIHLQKTRPPGENVFEAKVCEELFKGATAELRLKTGVGLELTAVVANESATQENFRIGDRVWCQIHPAEMVVVRPE